MATNMTNKSEYNEYQARVKRYNGTIVRSKSIEVIEEQRNRIFDLLVQNVTKGIVASKSLWPRRNKLKEIAERYISNIENSNSYEFDFHNDAPMQCRYYERCEYAK